MIVRCPRCSSRYRVREDKLPSGGGHIRCPGCGEVFPAVPEEPADPRQPTSTPSSLRSGFPEPSLFPPPPPLLAPQMRETPPQAPTPSTAAEEAQTRVLQVDAVSPFEVTRPSPLAPGASSEPRPPQAQPTTVLSPPEPARTKQAARQQWKLKSPVGLVYDFPDLQALKNWLSTKDSIDGMLASNDGGVSWKTLENCPELVDALPRKARRPRILTPGTDRRASLGVTGSGAAFPVLRPPPPPSDENIPTMALDGERTARTTALPPPAGSPEAATTLLRLQDTPGALDRRPETSTERRAVQDPAKSRTRPGQRSRASLRVRAASARAGQRRPGSRPHSGVITGHHARLLARKKKIGWITWSGLVLTILVLAAGAVQLSGWADLIGLVGLRSTPGPQQTSQAGRLGDNAAQPSETVTPPHALATGPASSETPPEVTGPPAESPAGANPHQARIDALVYQARLATEEGRIEDAIGHLRLASQLDRTDPDLICTLAELYWQAGLFQEADVYDIQCRTMRGNAVPSQNATRDRDTSSRTGDEPL
ncbi:MAG: zinc-ribbon domain-containing protein [Bradymonadales bacterium]|nr:zinc-ribbon domain-containing protein [Bradymonadales bacterium]